MNKTSLLELAKKLNIPRRNCMKTKEELEEAIKDTITGYKKIIFGSDTPACIACLDELQKQQVIDQKIYDQKLMEETMRKLALEGLQKNTVMLMEDTMRKLASEGLQKYIVKGGDTMIDKRTGEVLNPEVDSTYWKDEF